MTVQPLNLHRLRQSDCTQTKSLRSKDSSVQVLTMNTKCDEGSVTQEGCISENYILLLSEHVDKKQASISQVMNLVPTFIYSYFLVFVRMELQKLQRSEKIRREVKGVMSL